MQGIKYTNIENVKRNRRLLAFIEGRDLRGHFKSRKHSYREAATKFGLSSVGTVHRIVSRLRRRFFDN